MGTLQKLDAMRGDLKLRIASQLAEYKIDLNRQPADEDFEDEGVKKFNFYECSKCTSLYFGGLHECGEQVEVPQSELICGGCRGCKIHGSDHMIYKCRFCCSVATYFCFGHTHFCTPCHDKPWDIVHGNHYAYLKASLPSCPGKDKCPLG